MMLRIVEAHGQTLAIAEACARTTRDLAAEVARGGIPPKDDLRRTVEEAERVLADFDEVRREIERIIRQIG
ncbi:MAG: hypothetical protein AB7I25_13210 [Vicinamibacterales bacterium]